MEVKDADVLGDARGARRLGHGRDVVLQAPADEKLRGRLAVLAREPHKGLVAQSPIGQLGSDYQKESLLRSFDNAHRLLSSPAAKAFDLAIENIYSRTRRVLTRYAGLDYNSPRSEIAKRVADRSALNAHQLETLMRQSEEAINGGAITERQSIHLVKRLREVERSLGLRMRSREVKQSAQNI